MRSSAERVVLVRALAADIVLCSWVRVPLFTQAFTNPVMDYHLIQGGVELLLGLRATAAIGISSAPAGHSARMRMRDFNLHFDL